MNALANTRLYAEPSTDGRKLNDVFRRQLWIHACACGNDTRFEISFTLTALLGRAIKADLMSYVSKNF